jgi:hypothetical protein
MLARANFIPRGHGKGLSLWVAAACVSLWRDSLSHILSTTFPSPSPLQPLVIRPARFTSTAPFCLLFSFARPDSRYNFLFWNPSVHDPLSRRRVEVHPYACAFGALSLSVASRLHPYPLSSLIGWALDADPYFRIQ